MRLSDGALKSLARWQSAGNQLIRSCIQCAFAHYSGRCSSRVRRSNELLRDRKKWPYNDFLAMQFSFFLQRVHFARDSERREKYGVLQKARNRAREQRNIFWFREIKVQREEEEQPGQHCMAQGKKGEDICSETCLKIWRHLARVNNNILDGSI